LNKSRYLKEEILNSSYANLEASPMRVVIQRASQGGSPFAHSKQYEKNLNQYISMLEYNRQKGGSLLESGT
jgi:hypothetical protein